MPLRQDFHIEELPPALVPWCSLIESVTGPDGEVDFAFRFWGSARRDLIGFELTGKTAAMIPNETTRAATLETYASIFRAPRAVLRTMPLVTQSGRTVTLDFLRLPLAWPDDTCGYVFAVLDEASVTREHYEAYGTEIPYSKLRTRGS